MKKVITTHKIKHHLKTRAEARAHKKASKKSVHQVHADNLYKMAHPKSAKRQKRVRRTLSHVVLPVALIVATASFAIGAEVVRNSRSGPNPTPPPTPANSFCREFDNNALAAQDARIGMTLNNPQYPNTVTFQSSSYTRNYLYAVDANDYTYDLSNINNNRLNSFGVSFVYLKVCAADPGPAMPPFTTRNALVNQQYNDFFGRNATASEQAYWAGTGYNANQIVNWFVDQDGTKRGQLTRLYKAYYKRWPDAGGYAYWVDRMKAGMSLTRVSDSFANTPEFKTMYGSLNNSQFVTLVYQNVLGRNPEPAGYAYWLDRLDKKTITRGGMMLQFSESPENKTKFAKDSELVGVSLRMLRRPATASELVQWKAAPYDARSLAAYIFASSEYANRVVK